jgi:hypothetical protein
VQRGLEIDVSLISEKKEAKIPMRMMAILRVINTVPASKPTVPTTNWNWFVILSKPVHY